MSYCSREDLVNRLSGTGLLFVADDDADETASEAEKQATLDQAIAAAAVELDAALTPHVPLPLTTENEWLRRRAIDLAVEHLAERKGAAVPESLAKAAQRSRQWLEMVRQGELRVPGLAYPTDALEGAVRRLGLPRIANPQIEGDGEHRINDLRRGSHG